MQHLIKVVLENEAGALSRVVELFSKRGYNIDSLSVSPQIDSDLSVLNIATSGANSVIEQIIKQLENIIPVITAVDITTTDDYVSRELMLATIVTKTPESLKSIVNTIKDFNGYIIRQHGNTLVVQLTGDSKYFHTFINIIADDATIQYSNSGKIGISY